MLQNAWEVLLFLHVALAVAAARLIAQKARGWIFCFRILASLALVSLLGLL